MGHFLFLVLLLNPALAEEDVNVQSAEEHDAQAIKNLKMIQSNSYGTERGLEEYGANFGPEFRAKISALRAHDVWVDLGAGDAVALKQYLTAKSIPGFNLPPIEQRAKVVALAYLKPKPMSKLDQKLQKVLEIRGSGAYTEIIGDFTEIPKSLIPKATIITSEKGVISYVEDFTYAMQKSFDVLKKDGEMFIDTGVQNIDFADRETLTPKSPSNHLDVHPTRYGEEYRRPIEKHLHNIPGARQKAEPRLYLDDVVELPNAVLDFQKSAEEVDFPNFKVVKFESNNAPVRVLSPSPESRKLELEARFAKEEERYRHGMAHIEINRPQPAPPKKSTCAHIYQKILKNFLGRERR